MSDGKLKLFESMFLSLSVSKSIGLKGQSPLKRRGELRTGTGARKSYCDGIDADADDE